MSRIGRKEIPIPEDVKVKLSDHILAVNGPLGSLEVKIRDEVQLLIEENRIIIKRKADDKLSKSLHGLTRALVANAIEGVEKGYQKDLEIIGVGYRASIEDGVLKLRVGFSHDVSVSPPEGIGFEVEKNVISVRGIDKQLVGQVAAEIRAIKKPEPYKGKGIRYLGEKVIRKVGKAVKATATGA
ncbi:MAG: 50S ribosomal protein L6 [Candidatus Berkelbacteria bacterium]|nr:50S ribosomal protein L6 [Candidatus Berkelbacteria bacterium]